MCNKRKTKHRYPHYHNESSANEVQFQAYMMPGRHSKGTEFATRMAIHLEFYQAT